MPELNAISTPRLEAVDVKDEITMFSLSSSDHHDDTIQGEEPAIQNKLHTDNYLK